MRNFDTEIEIEARIEYSYSKGTPDRFSRSFGNWLPGDPPEVSDIKAYVSVPLKTLQDALQRAEAQGQLKDEAMVEIDLFGSLDRREASHIEEACYEEAGNE